MEYYEYYEIEQQEPEEEDSVLPVCSCCKDEVLPWEHKDYDGMCYYCSVESKINAEIEKELDY